MSQHPRPRFTYLGHATIRCDLPGGQVVLIDPWVQGNPGCPEGCKTLDRLDAMLITHAHFDHMGDALDLCKGHTPEKVGFQVTMVRADHSCGLSDGDQILYGGVAAGYVVRLPGGYTFYHAGDTALFSDMQLIGEMYRPELAFLPIGDLFTMDPLQAARACRYLGVRKVIPIHWGTFPALTGTPEKLEKALEAHGTACEVITLKPGESY
jgi:L-ascorbate metabolism protein UlaG (beta-lactamase superfamily)